MIGSRQLAQALEIGSFAGQDMFFCNRLEGLGCKGQVHRVPGFVLEIDSESREDRIDRLDPPKSPTPVHAKPAVGKLHQRFDVMAVQFPG